jgi:hypothetical protein
MKILINIGIVFCYLFCYSCNYKPNIASSSGQFIRTEVSDSVLTNILNNYITEFSFDGKGVYLVNIDNYEDSIKYYVGITFSKHDINRLLKDPPYFFYSKIKGRTVIIDTKIESFFKPQCHEFESDTILSNYYDNSPAWGIREVYFVEFTRIGDDLRRKVIYFNPF